VVDVSRTLINMNGGKAKSKREGKRRSSSFMGATIGRDSGSVYSCQSGSGRSISSKSIPDHVFSTRSIGDGSMETSERSRQKNEILRRSLSIDGESESLKNSDQENRGRSQSLRRRRRRDPGADDCAVKDLQAESYTPKEKREKTSLTLSCVTEAMNINEEIYGSIPIKVARIRTEKKEKSTQILQASIAEGYEDDTIYDSPRLMLENTSAHNHWGQKRVLRSASADIVWKKDMLRMPRRYFVSPDLRRGRLRDFKWNNLEQSHSDGSRDGWRRKKTIRLRRPSYREESEEEATSCPSLNLHWSSLSGSPTVRSSRSCTPPDVMVKDLAAEEYAQRTALRADRRAEKSSMALPCVTETMVCDKETNEVTSLQTLARNKEMRKKKSFKILRDSIAEEQEDAVAMGEHASRRLVPVTEEGNSEDATDDTYSRSLTKLTTKRDSGLLSSDSWPVSLTTASDDDLDKTKKNEDYKKLHKASKREVKGLKRELWNSQLEVESLKKKIKEMEIKLKSKISSPKPKAKTI